MNKYEIDYEHPAWVVLFGYVSMTDNLWALLVMIPLIYYNLHKPVYYG